MKIRALFIASVFLSANVLSTELPLDDEIADFYRRLVEILARDPDFIPDEDDSEETPPPREGPYDTRSRKRKAAPPATESAPFEKRARIDRTGIPAPIEIYQELIQYTIGQDEVMKSLSIFIHSHLINTRINESKDCLESPPTRPMDKSNILMVGPTGSGKTSTLEVLARYLSTLLVVGNATEWTSQGYSGRKWQDIFEDLWSSAQSRAGINNDKPTPNLKLY